MKSVLASFKPQYCELIASGKKTVELRKTRPKLETPFKVYMYQTKTVYVSKSKENDLLIPIKQNMGKVIGEFVCDEIDTYEIEYPSRFENVYRAIYRHIKDEDGVEYSFIEASNDMTDDELSNSRLLSQSQLTLDEIGKYVCGKKQSFNNFYGWHISDLVIYDKPRELGELRKLCIDKYEYCDGCKYGHIQYPAWVETSEDLDGVCYDTFCLNRLTRPPQSWCYVEEEF